MLSHHGHRTVDVSGGAGERGVIVAVAALSMVTILIVIALVIDGSQAYPQRRNMQNAADAAALAGTRALDRVKYSGQGWATVDSTVQSVASDNGAESAECSIIAGGLDADGSAIPLGPCSDAAAVARSDAAGVLVRATDVRDAYLGDFTDTETVSARASAAATIQTFVGGGTGSPFVICGNPMIGGYDYLDQNGAIDPVRAMSVGRVPIQGSQIPTCNAGAAFKGKIDPDADIPALPAVIAGDNGNGFDGDIQVQVLGSSACTSDDVARLQQDGTVDCDMILPIGDKGWGNGQNISINAVAWAVFHVEGNGKGNPKYYGTFVGTNPYVSGGRTSTSLPANGSTLRAIRLVM